MHELFSDGEEQVEILRADRCLSKIDILHSITVVKFVPAQLFD